MAKEQRVHLFGQSPGHDHRTTRVGKQFADHVHQVIDRFAGRIHGLSEPGPKLTVMINPAVPQIGEWKLRQARRRFIGGDSPGSHLPQEDLHSLVVHDPILACYDPSSEPGRGRRADLAYPPDVTETDQSSRRVGYLGPAGTFTEEAMLTQPDLREADLIALDSIPDVLAATDDGSVDLGFVAIENAIEGTVTVTQDVLAFTSDLLIQREVVMPVKLHLLGVPGTSVNDIERIMSFPHASGQCRDYLEATLPGALLEATNSTADAARILGVEGDRSAAAIATTRAAELYGLEVLAPDIEDHPDNATRFVIVARHVVPPPTGHDKTSLVVYQRADTPGSLLGILQEFAARAINLTKLESRPTRQGLGDYCFLIDLEGHIHDEVVADALRSLKTKQKDVKFIGSYPAAGDHGPDRRRERDEAWQQAQAWLADLRSRIATS